MQRTSLIHSVHWDYLNLQVPIHSFLWFLPVVLEDQLVLVLYCSSGNTFLIWLKYVYRTCISLVYYSAAESEMEKIQQFLLLILNGSLLKYRFVVIIQMFKYLVHENFSLWRFCNVNHFLYNIVGVLVLHHHM